VRREEIRELGFGAVVLILFAAALAISYAGTSRGSMQNAGYPLTAIFNRVDGIGPGTDVLVSGISVGEVAQIELLPDYRVAVTLEIERGVTLPEDSSVAIHTDGLFGSKFVSIEPGGSETMLEAGGAILYTQDAVVVSELLDLIISQGQAVRAPAPAAEN
jgi:phospholipid/cholesterol/gamma-HCH transport system substrate-binding protein